MKRRFIQLKDTPEYKKGAIFEVDEDSDWARCINHKEFVTIEKYKENNWGYSGDIITKQPEWFEEVDLLWLTREQIRKVKKFLGIDTYV